MAPKSADPRQERWRRGYLPAVGAVREWKSASWSTIRTRSRAALRCRHRSSRGRSRSCSSAIRTLTQDSVRALLQKNGARPACRALVLDERQIGHGALNLEGALSVANRWRRTSPALRVPGAQELARALRSPTRTPRPRIGPSSATSSCVTTREIIADGFDDRRLHLVATPATLTEDLTRIAAGFYRLYGLTRAGSTSGGGTAATWQVLIRRSADPRAARRADRGRSLGRE